MEVEDLVADVVEVQRAEHGRRRMRVVQLAQRVAAQVEGAAKFERSL